MTMDSRLRRIVAASASLSLAKHLKKSKTIIMLKYVRRKSNRRVDDSLFTRCKALR
jgi:hypothetical protein